MTDNSRRISRVRPATDTKFRIDYSWWEGQEDELHAYLLSLLPADQRAMFEESSDDAPQLDWVDPQTAEVKQIDALQQALRSSVEDAEELRQIPLVDAVFRIFLTNGNTPLSPDELEEFTGRPSRTILRTIAGARIYKGLRPAIENDDV